MNEQPETTSAKTMDRYKRDLAFFRGVMTAVNISPEQDQALRSTLHTILDYLGPDFAGLVVLRDGRHPGLRIAAQRGVWGGDAPGRVFADGCPCLRVMETRMPTFEANCPNPACHGSGSGCEGHSHLLAPLKTRQGTGVGALCLFCPPEFEADTVDLSLWEDIGVQMGRAVEDARFHAQLDRSRELLQTLYELSDHLATSLDLEWVLGQVLVMSISATEARDGSIFLLPGAEIPAPRILHRDLPPKEADEVIEEVLTRGLAGWVVQNREGALVADAAEDPRWLTFPDDPDPPRSILAMPLIATDRVLGVLTLDHTAPDHFSTQHMGLMRAIAHQASMAIEKARLHKEVFHMAEVLADRVEERTRELVETQAQLVQAEKLAALGELAAGVAHEINNPLHILQAYVEYMASQATADTPFVDFLDPMQNALESIARLAGQLRDFSRPAGGEWKLLDLNKGLENVLRLVNKELLHCQVEVKQQLTPGLPHVMGDIRQLEQVFLNLILNARDAMPGGGQLTIQTSADTDTVYIRITDTGTGIADDDLERIFEPYFTTKEDRGTGLGLAICQRIVTQHGGRITVSSKVGQGAKFVIHLKVPTMDPPAA